MQERPGQGGPLRESAGELFGFATSPAVFDRKNQIRKFVDHIEGHFFQPVKML
jgi:hypothetical protein